MKSVMTIHNLKFQGVWNIPTVQDATGLDMSYFTADKLEAFGDANYLKGGIVYADRITTVSRTYARRSRLRSSESIWMGSCVPEPDN